MLIGYPTLHLDSARRKRIQAQLYNGLVLSLMELCELSVLVLPCVRRRNVVAFMDHEREGPGDLIAIRIALSVRGSLVEPYLLPAIYKDNPAIGYGLSPLLYDLDLNQ